MPPTGHVFKPGASAFVISSGDSSFNSKFTISGAGIINDSGVVQIFYTPNTTEHGNVYPNTFYFKNTASAGALTHFCNSGSSSEDYWHGLLKFGQQTTAGSAAINNLGGSIAGGETDFLSSSNAGNAAITNEAGDGIGGSLAFYDLSSAASATIINEGATVSGGEGGQLYFVERSDAANSTITCRGATVSDAYPATVSLENASKAGKARIVLFGDGKMSVYYHDAPGITIGSLAGNGAVLLGANTLTIGSNNRSTTFAGIVEDTAFGAGSPAKVGTGSLTLTGANTYTGSTTVLNGELVINNRSGSASGTGPVEIRAGTLSGGGTIAGTVTIGNAGGTEAFLSPGAKETGTLTSQSEVTFEPGSTYAYDINTISAQADELTADGVTINRGTIIAITTLGHVELAAGTVFTMINNTAATPISGSFADLRDGSTFAARGNRFLVSYEGGDGNDLTLTVQ